MNRKKCKGCEVEFVALRSDAVTCGAKCRQRYKRMCDKITAELAKTHDRCTSCDMPKLKTTPSPCRQCRDHLSGASLAVQDRSYVCSGVALADELSGDYADLTKCQRCGSRVGVVNGCCRMCFEREMFGQDDE
jgi:hypothetical protein